jgi:hypothetical protein
MGDLLRFVIRPHANSTITVVNTERLIKMAHFKIAVVKSIDVVHEKLVLNNDVEK